MAAPEILSNLAVACPAAARDCDGTFAEPDPVMDQGRIMAQVMESHIHHLAPAEGTVSGWAADPSGLTTRVDGRDKAA